MNHYVMLLSCPDTMGVVNALTQKLLELEANIIDADQYSTSPIGGTFFMRVAFVCQASEHDIYRVLHSFIDQFSASITIKNQHSRMTISILVSKEDHCLQELLYQSQTGDISVAVASIISNHDCHSELAKQYSVPFNYVDYHNKSAAEAVMLSVTKSMDALVMARFMQVLSPNFLRAFARPIINIHHSFLPSFKGAKPYQQAFDRGVKIIGATAHFASSDLDEGPIISQHVVSVNHRYTIEQLKRIGRGLEKSTLVDALRKVSEHRVIIHGNKTIVFD